MASKLSAEDAEKLKALTAVRERNNEFSWMLSDYLNNNPNAITRELMESVNPNGALNEETVYCALLMSFCGLDPENNERDKLLANDYFRPSVKKLDTRSYLDNPYYRNIRIPEVKFGRWELSYEKYQPYEAFIYKDLVSEAVLKEYPCLGFFTEEFAYPVVSENDHEWMAIKPSEIGTIQPAIDAIKGEVVTFGLGLGYFAYMASVKENVQRVTVVEHDAEVIRLFGQYILPQFQQKEKVEIIHADAFEYAEKQMPDRNFGYAFVDLWHDASDGLNLYLRMKKTEALNCQTKFIYWIEDWLLSGLSWQIFDLVTKRAKSYSEIVQRLSKPSLQKLAAATDIINNFHIIKSKR
ncbi:MAG: hypothetical protein ACYC2P_05775 [Paludibacteraceae bacterium]